MEEDLTNLEAMLLEPRARVGFNLREVVTSLLQEQNIARGATQAPQLSSHYSKHSSDI